MTTSDRTMSQVRAILQRLDRSIDEARQRRTHPAPAPAAAVAPIAPSPAPVPGVQAGAQAPTPAPAAAPARAASPFGRAQPLNRPPQPLRWGS